MEGLRCTLGCIPATASDLAATGLPLGICITPLGLGRTLRHGRQAPGEEDPPRLAAPPPGRCGRCGAYICPQAALEAEGWACALCGDLNEYSRADNWRYMPGSPGWVSPPELLRHAGPLDILSTGPNAMDVPCRLLTILVLDAGGSPEALAAAARALQAGMEAIAQDTLVGLVTYGTEGQETVYIVNSSAGTTPAVRVLLPVALDPPPPPSQWLLPVHEYKEGFLEALQELEGLAQGQLQATDEDVQASSPPSSPPTPPPSSPPTPPPPADLTRALAMTLAALEGEAEGVAALRWPDPGDVGLVPALACTRLLLFPSRPHQGVEGEGAGSPRTGGGSPAPEVADLGALRPNLTPWAGDRHRPDPGPQLAKGSPSSGLREGEGEGAAAAVAGAPQLYTSLALAMAEQGLVMDVFGCGPSALGLSSLAAAASRTGGATVYYAVPSPARLARDVCKRLTSSMATECLLRLRCSPGVFISQALSPMLLPHERESDGLWHAAACHPGTTWAVEVGVGGVQGVAAFQVALQFLTLVPGHDEVGGEGSGTTWRLQRRLRVSTLACQVADPLHGPGRPSALAGVYDAADSAAVATVLTQQALRALPGLGTAHLSAALEEWMVELLHHTRAGAAHGNGGGGAPHFLSGLLRALRSLLRALAALDADGDASAALRALWATLPPQDLMASLYPCMSSWTSNDAQAFAQHALSQSALRLSGARLFLLDAFHTLLIVESGAPGSEGDGPLQHWPPPRGSALRQCAEAAASSRFPTPVLVMTRGLEALTPFLLDDEGSRQASNPGDGPLAGLCHAAFLRELEVHAAGLAQ